MMDRQLKHSGSFNSVSLQASQINPLPHPFTFESQENSCSQINFSEHDHETDHTQCRNQIQRQYKLKMQSMIKQYEVKLAKERQTFELKQKNYEEELQNMKKQLRDALYTKSEKKTESQSYCSICSNGEVLKHMKNMLESVEDSHRNCLIHKQQLNSQIQSLEQKVSVFEQQCLLTQQKCKKAKQQIRQLKQEKEGFEREKRQKERQYREKQRLCQVKEIQLDQQLNKARALEKELEKEFKTINVERQKQTIDHQYLKKQEKQNQRMLEFRDTNYHRQAQSIGNQLTKNSSYLKPTNLNSSHVNPNWKTKMNESYAEYAGMKRKSKRGDYPYEGTVQFDTFRPHGKFSYLD